MSAKHETLCFEVKPQIMLSDIQNVIPPNCLWVTMHTTHSLRVIYFARFFWRERLAYVWCVLIVYPSCVFEYIIFYGLLCRFVLRLFRLYPEFISFGEQVRGGRVKKRDTRLIEGGKYKQMWLWERTSERYRWEKRVERNRSQLIESPRSRSSDRFVSIDNDMQQTRIVYVVIINQKVYRSR